MDQVERGNLEKGRGSVLAQLAGVGARIYEAECRVKETEQIIRNDFLGLTAKYYA